jgi:hypothetical protein
MRKHWEPTEVMPSECELSHQVLQDLGRRILSGTGEDALLSRRIKVLQLLFRDVDDGQRPVICLVVDGKEYLFKCEMPQSKMVTTLSRLVDGGTEVNFLQTVGLLFKHRRQLCNNPEVLVQVQK